MRNPLLKRLPRELKAEAGKYLVIFLFIVGFIGIISGDLVAGMSMKHTCDASKEKYNVEDGNFDLYFEGSQSLIDKIEEDGDVKIYENFYYQGEAAEVDANVRIYAKREEVNLESILEGEFPSDKNQIAISRTFAKNENNNLSIGDILTIDDIEYEISGFVSMPDYTTMFESSTDMMFDSARFGVAIVTDDGFERLPKEKLTYRYSWIYNDLPESEEEQNERAQNLVEIISKDSKLNFNAITGFSPAFTNQAIIFAADDIGGDTKGIEIFGYMVVIILAFIFAITINNTVYKEAKVIGTLRASGYTKWELILHYMFCPMLVVLMASIVGNVLGYTVIKDFCGNVYYSSYDLPPFVVEWNMNAFVKTTIIPVIICLCINFFTLYNKLSLSPLKFLRNDIGKKRNKKAIKLSKRTPIMRRFRLRIILQNMPNYITMVIGMLLSAVLLLFAISMPFQMDKYSETVVDNLFADYQYILKAKVDTSNKDAEKTTVSSLKTTYENRKQEEISIYGVSSDSSYIKIPSDALDKNEVYISSAYAKKYNVAKGDRITLKECYEDEFYEFSIKGIYEYPSVCAVFMNRTDLNELIGEDEDYFNVYLSSSEITDIDNLYISSVIDADAMLKVSRQLKHSMGSFMYLVDVFGVVMFMLIIYLLSKIIIERNSSSISMTKILGYKDKEINSLYIMATSIVVVISLLIAIPLSNVMVKQLWYYFLSDYPGWFEYSMDIKPLIEVFAMGIASYSVIGFVLSLMIKKTNLSIALKNAE